MAGKSGRVSQGWELEEGKQWPERMVGYEKDGNYRREKYGRKEWESIKRKRIVGGNYGGKNKSIRRMGIFRRKFERGKKGEEPRVGK